MGNARFIYNNLITTASMITASSRRVGFCSSATKNGAGSATMYTSGNFSGQYDLKYIITIDSVSAGNEIGESTFKWGYVDADDVYTIGGSGVITAIGATLLNNDVYVSFETGSGNDFELNDQWYFIANARFNEEKMLLWPRKNRHRTNALESPNYWNINLGSAKQIKAFILFDHNLTSGATGNINLKGDADNANWGTPDVTETITYNANKIVHYMDQTYRYWQPEITDAANSDNYIEIGKMFLGSYLELSVNFDIDSKRNYEGINDNNTNDYGINSYRHYNLKKTWRLSYTRISSTDFSNLETMFEALFNRDKGTVQPFYFNIDSSAPNSTWMVNLLNLPSVWHARNYYSTDLILEEVLTSV